jgi:hypothetical protein
MSTSSADGTGFPRGQSFPGVAEMYATQGRTPNSVRAKFVGNWQRCSIRNGGGNFVSCKGSPISSYASLRAVCNGDSESDSALPPGRAA